MISSRIKIWHLRTIIIIINLIHIESYIINLIHIGKGLWSIIPLSNNLWFLLGSNLTLKDNNNNNKSDSYSAIRYYRYPHSPVHSHTVHTNAIRAHMNIHETIIFIHIYTCLHINIYTVTCTNIYLQTYKQYCPYSKSYTCSEPYVCTRTEFSIVLICIKVLFTPGSHSRAWVMPLVDAELKTPSILLM